MTTRRIDFNVRRERLRPARRELPDALRDLLVDGARQSRGRRT